MKVWATKYNLVYHLDKIINRQLNPNIEDYLLEDLLFSKSNNSYLTDYSIQQCYFLAEFLNNPDVFLKNHGKVWEDTNSFYVESRPSFHYDGDCEKMNSKFVNVTIPKRFRNNNEIVKMIRDSPVSILNPELSKDVISKLCLKINTKLNLSKPISINEFDHLKFNSGVNMQLENDIGELIIKTEELHKKTEVYLKSNPKLYQYRNSNYKLPNFNDFKKDYSLDYRSIHYFYNKLSNDLSYFRKYLLAPVRIRLKYYVLGKFNPSVEFEKDVLEVLGFVSCKSCRSRKS